MQLCKECKIEKPLDDYYAKPSNKNGHSKVCKTCDLKKRYMPCNSCGQKSRRGTCKKCSVKDTYEKYCTLTIGDKVYNKHKHAKYAYIRYWARKIAIDAGWNCCNICGYDKHFEIAHIKSISEFSPDTLLTTVNDPDNLIALCPNCHWEFDFGQQKKNMKIVKEKYNFNILRPETRKVTRPPYEQLLQEIEESNYCAVGRKYNVSDNTIRKWIKMYEKYSSPAR